MTANVRLSNSGGLMPGKTNIMESQLDGIILNKYFLKADYEKADYIKCNKCK